MLKGKLSVSIQILKAQLYCNIALMMSILTKSFTYNICLDFLKLFYLFMRDISFIIYKSKIEIKSVSLDNFLY